MTQPRTMLLLAEEYLSERRRLGFDLTISGAQVMAFARFVDEIGHTGPITTRVVLDWVKGKARHAKQRPGLGVSKRFGHSQSIWNGGIQPPSFRARQSSAHPTGGSRPISTPSRRLPISWRLPGASRQAVR